MEQTVNDEPSIHETLGHAPPFDEHGQISIRIDKADFEKLVKIQGLMMIEAKKNYTRAQAFHELIEKWDSLIKSYDSLKNLQAVE